MRRRPDRPCSACGRLTEASDLSSLPGRVLPAGDPQVCGLCYREAIRLAAGLEVRSRGWASDTRARIEVEESKT